MDNTKTKTKMDNTKPKPKPRWFSGPIFPKYNDPKPANFEYKPMEKLLKPNPKIPWYDLSRKI